ncbi:MAG TPA: hypothetical protein VGB06_00300 [Solirubrobacterales bacterium]
MRGLRPSGLLALTAALFALVLGGSVASADTGDVIEEQHTPATAEDGFQAGTCIANREPPPPAPPTKYCSPQTPELFYTQAAGHPPVAFSQYIVKHVNPNPADPSKQIPVTLLNEIRVDAPAGLTVNPQATPQCEIAVFLANEANCPVGSIVGKEELWLATVVELNPNPFPFIPGASLPAGTQIPPNPFLNTEPPLYNLVPETGEPARLGFKIGPAKFPVFVRGSVAWESDYHQGFFIKIPPPSSPALRSLKSRLVSKGRAGDGTFVTNPTTCFDPDTGVYSTFLRAQGTKPAELAQPFPEAFTPWEAKLPPGVELTGCDKVPFEPGLDVKPGTDKVDSPAGPEVTVTLPFRPDPEGLEQSHVRNASVTLPAGMGLNPSAADDLVACTDEQFGKGTRNPVACPEGSKIGTVEVETPPLPPDSLNGNVYLATQESTDPESGEMYRIFINPKSERFDVDVRLVGNISANAATGQLTAHLRETPQVPFESVTMKLDAAKETLTSPPTCGPNQTTSAMEPWARPGTFANPASSFALANLPGGGPCPATLAERPFSPNYSAGPTETKAGAFTPFVLHLTRSDGEQEFRQVKVTLPPGMTAQLRNLDYCPEQRIDDAEKAFTGTRESAVPPPPCPDRSFLGTSRIAAGSGPNPFVANGNVYLAGPYKGAPLSLVFMTPAVAGPFDLGTVVVRTAIHVDPETVQVTAVSDPIPWVFGGAKLGIRDIDVSIHRKPFTLNPTSCKSSEIPAEISGGGGDPNDPAAWSKVQRSSKFQATKCGALKFGPRFTARIFGGRNQANRAANPKFRAILWGHYGDANVKRASFITPRALILDQSHIRTICTRVQLAAEECPKGSIYGYARARSPLLSEVVKGPVYLTSSKHELPDLLADLKGQIDVQLRGVISAVNGRLKTVFPRVPDVPVRKFVLTMKGGNRGLLVNSENLCAQPRFGKLNLKAHNGKKKVNNRLRLRLDPCR